MTDLASLTDKISAAAGAAPAIGKAVKFDFGADGLIHIDGTGDKNVTSNADGEADATIQIAMSDLVLLAKGELDPMMAFMSGKMKIQGDMMLAQRLAPLLRG